MHAFNQPNDGGGYGPYSHHYYYDQYGNITGRIGWGGTNSSFTATYTNNRRDGLQYDLSGNLTNDGGQAFSYDATGQQSPRKILEEIIPLIRLSIMGFVNTAWGMELTAVTDERPVDARVVESCQQGDREAFRLLFETHKDRVYSIALYFFGGDAGLAGDITQQVFLKLFTRIGQFRHQSEFTTWLYRLTTNTCIDEQRRRRRFSPFPETLAGTPVHAIPAAEARFMRIEMADSVREAIASLKPKLRIAILLKYFEELSYEEIATILNCSKGTVASRLNRGHRILAQRLGHLRANFISGD